MRPSSSKARCGSSTNPEGIATGLPTRAHPHPSPMGGGSYAIDASPIATTCYVLAIVLALFLIRRQRRRAHLH